MMNKTKSFIRNRKFYDRLGFKLNGDPKNDQLVSFFLGRDDLIMHFFRADLFEDASKGNAADLSRGNKIMYTIGANSRKEVNTWAEQVIDEWMEQYRKFWEASFDRLDEHLASIR